MVIRSFISFHSIHSYSFIRSFVHYFVKNRLYSCVRSVAQLIVYCTSTSSSYSTHALNVPPYLFSSFPDQHCHQFALRRRAMTYPVTQRRMSTPRLTPTHLKTLRPHSRRIPKPGIMMQRRSTVIWAGLHPLGWWLRAPFSLEASCLKQGSRLD